MSTFYVPPTVRTLILDLLDRASAEGNQLYECDEGTAEYYARYVSTIKTESAYESLDLLDSDDPLRGWGFYAYHDIQPRQDGLFVLITDEIVATVSQYLIRGLVQPGLVIPCSPQTARAARSKLWVRIPNPEWAEQLRHLRLDAGPGGTVIGTQAAFRYIPPDEYEKREAHEMRKKD
jgi:hypothetical protein